MTPYQMSKELDAQVAAEVMGWTQITRHENSPHVGLNPEYPNAFPCHIVPNYSTNLWDAWAVLEAVDLDWKIEPHQVEFERPAEQDDGPMYYEATRYVAHRPTDMDDGPGTTAYMICCAALKAVRDKHV